MCQEHASPRDARGHRNCSPRYTRSCQWIVKSTNRRDNTPIEAPAFVEDALSSSPSTRRRILCIECCINIARISPLRFSLKCYPCQVQLGRTRSLSRAKNPCPWDKKSLLIGKHGRVPRGIRGFLSPEIGKAKDKE